MVMGLAALLTAWRMVRQAPDLLFARRPPKLQKVVAQPAAPPAREADFRRHLVQAGFTHRAAEQRFRYLRLFLAALGFVVALALTQIFPQMVAGSPAQLAGILLLAPLPGYYLPGVVVNRLRQGWLLRIQLALPDALDFLLICVEAGQSVDLAVMRVAQELEAVHPDLSQKLHSLTEALTAGADREEAWMRLVQETENDDLRQLATIILQSGMMGTPVAHTLRVFSADLRDKRVRQVEEKANVLPTKMTLGTMLFTVPPLLILLLAPAVFRIALAG